MKYNNLINFIQNGKVKHPRLRHGAGNAGLRQACKLESRTHALLTFIDHNGSFRQPPIGEKDLPGHQEAVRQGLQ